MEAALEAEVSELRLTVASPTSMTVDGGRSAEAEHERDENASPSRAVRSDAYWGSRGPRPVVRRADVAGVAPVREEGDYEKRYDELQRFSPKPAVSRPARRGGRDAGAPVAQATGDASPIVERPKWGGKYDDDGLRVSLRLCVHRAQIEQVSSEGESKPRRRSNEGAQHATPAD